MLYLRNNTTTQTILVPKVISELQGELSLRAVSTVDLASVDLGVIDGYATDGYYHLTVVLEDGMQSGEYKYILSDQSQVLATGLMVINDEVDPEETDKTIEYEQYETDI